MIHAKILEGLQKELQNKYEISSIIRHKGERGRKREHGVAEFLRENLPEAYGVGTGELFSFNAEGVSPQCDVVVFDRMRTPIFGKQSAVQQIPIEGVFVVIEVRSVLDTHALKDAAKKFQAIRDLWATSHPNVGRQDEWDNGPAFYLFGFKLTTTQNNCLRFLTDNNAEDCSIVALDAGFSTWIGRGPSLRAIWFDITNPRIGRFSTLALFFFDILGRCQTELKRLDMGKIFMSCMPGRK
jgi:hypothetical protein